MPSQNQGLKVVFKWESIVSVGDFIKLCEYLDKNPLTAAFEVEVHGKADVVQI